MGWSTTPINYAAEASALADSTPLLANDWLELLREQLTSKATTKPHVLLVDDDPLFGKIMAKVAKKREIPLTYCKSIKEITKIKRWTFDVALFDYDLGNISGIQLCHYIEQYRQAMPIILFSEHPQIETNEWADCIRGFLPKSVGHQSILMAAIVAHDKWKNRPL